MNSPAHALQPPSLQPTRRMAQFRLGRAEVQSELAQLILAHPGIGRADIARLTGMARSTVSEHVQPLIAAGLLGERRARYAGRGRPSLGLSLNAVAGMVAVADIGITHARLLLADLAGRQLASDAFAPDIASGPEALLGEILHRFACMRQSEKLQGLPLRVLVLGLPSPVDFARGVPVRPPIMPGWDGFAVADWLSTQLGTPVLVDNDVNLMALGEARSRPASQSPLLFVKAASGIGCGLVTANGELHRGADGDAGDIGHIRVAHGEPVPCKCGNSGCIEAIASASALAQQIRAARGLAGHAPVDLAALLAAGDALTQRLLRQAGADIGEIVALLVNMFNPACIVLGGKLAHISDDLLSGVRAAVYRRAPPLATRRLTVENSSLGRDAGLLGGLALGLDRALSAAGIQGLLAPGTAAPGTATP